MHRAKLLIVKKAFLTCMRNYQVSTCEVICNAVFKSEVTYGYATGAVYFGFILTPSNLKADVTISFLMQ